MQASTKPRTSESSRMRSQVAPVILITQEPNEQSKPFVKAYAGANQQLIGKVAGEITRK